MKRKVLPEVVERLYLVFREIHEKYPELSNSHISKILAEEVVPAIYKIASTKRPFSWQAYMELLNALYNCAIHERMLHEEAHKNSQQLHEKSQQQEENQS